MPKSKPSHHDPLPLGDLKGWVLPDIYEWLAIADREAAIFQEELDAQGTDQITTLFSRTGDKGGDDDDDSDADQCSVNSARSDADYEGYYGRIRVWTSSRDNVDGFGATYKGPPPPDQCHRDDAGAGPRNATGEEDHSIRIVYVISESWEGYGDLLWASSRHLGQLFADPVKCRDLLTPLLEGRGGIAGGAVRDHHPLQDLSVLELGAGCGVPSLMAMKCGAKVVCTDLDNPNRIRCIAESMHRNWCELAGGGGGDNNDEENDTDQRNRKGPVRFHRGRACPFRWGRSTVPVTKTLKELEIESASSSSMATTDNVATTSSCSDDTKLFDVICATDCLFMPWLHYDLLVGMDELLAPDGVVIIAFAIHEGYSKDDEVWPFVDKAKERGFTVEILDAVQLTPPKKGMPAKQGLVNMLRLARRDPIQSCNS
jgi:predicted nicotinamide N-methyase